MLDDNFENTERNDPYAINDDNNPQTESPEPSVAPTEQNAAENQDNVESDTVTNGGPSVSEEKQTDQPTEEPADSSRNEEANSIGSDIIRGHINTIILRALYERDKYGYEIMNDIEVKSHGQYSLKQPTLYSALKRLENQGYIRAYWKTDEVTSGGRRKYFTLTESGKEITEKNLAEWEYSRTIIDSLISDRSFDFSQPAPTPVDFHILKNSVSRVPIVRSDEAGRAAQIDGETAISERGAEQKNNQQINTEPNNVQTVQQPVSEQTSVQTTEQVAQQQTVEQTNGQTVQQQFCSVQQQPAETLTPSSVSEQQSAQQTELTAEQLQVAQQQAIIEQQQQTIEAQQQAIAVQQ
ncbi:MAG: PadR family transcriptional regulator, partial [Clostridia bacterium]|nr:PadR family transcriptional regulator [Clostridia bacterium]